MKPIRTAILAGGLVLTSSLFAESLPPKIIGRIDFGDISSELGPFSKSKSDIEKNIEVEFDHQAGDIVAAVTSCGCISIDSINVDRDKNVLKAKLALNKSGAVGVKEREVSVILGSSSGKKFLLEVRFSNSFVAKLLPSFKRIESGEETNMGVVLDYYVHTRGLQLATAEDVEVAVGQLRQGNVHDREIVKSVEIDQVRKDFFHLSFSLAPEKLASAAGGALSIQVKLGKETCKAVLVVGKR